MKTLLLNGCSFGTCWQPSSEFISALGCDNLENISKDGTSFQRACRTTIEWIAQNGNPKMVLLPMTFSHRWELALNEDEDNVDGSWVPLQNSNFLSNTYNLHNTSIDDVKKLVDDYYKIIPTIKTHWDMMFTNMIMMAGFLDSTNIPYLMWDMCNGFDKIHLTRNTKERERYKAFEKIKLIEENKRIIDIWKFCANRYMRDTMPADIQQKTPEMAYHHDAPQYKHLENYILNYLNSIDQ